MDQRVEKQQKNSETKSLFFVKINKIDKYLATLTKGKKWIITSMSNEIGDITIVLTEMKRIINEYYEQLNANTLDNLDEMNK